MAGKRALDRRRGLVPWLWVAASLVLPSAAQTVTASTRPVSGTGTITGRITAERGKTLPEMIVYLESTDSTMRFEPPKEPVHVSQRDAKFTPSLIVVCAGQTVDFSNDEPRPLEHNVFSRSPAKPFDLGLYKPGTGPKLVKFDAPGIVRLFCSIHRYMDGVIFVTPTPFHAKVADDGTYRINGVPAGEWKVKTWQRNARFNEREFTVKVTAGQTIEQHAEMSRK